VYAAILRACLRTEREEYVETGTRIVARVDEALAAVIAREAVGGTVGDVAVSGG